MSVLLAYFISPLVALFFKQKSLLVPFCFPYWINVARQKFFYLVHGIEQPNFGITNPQYLQLNFCFDFFNDSENTF